MKAILRSTVLAAGVASIAVLGVTPATATHGAVTFHGTASIDEFGNGASGGTAELWWTGTAHDVVGVEAKASASFTLDEPPATCPFTGTATGSVSGSGLFVTFAWSRVGAVAVISTQGSIRGSGAATFAVTSHVGSRCPAVNVKAEFAGSLAGL